MRVAKGLCLLATLLAGLVACEPDKDHPIPIAGTTYRIHEQTWPEENDVTMKIFDSWADCANNRVSDAERCQPFANRSTGEVRLGFEIRDPSTQSALPRFLTLDDIVVTHDGARQDNVQLIPHEPVKSGQLFILLIDGSSSMFEDNGAPMGKVWQALLAKKVIRGFFPADNNKTGVALLRFNEKVVGLDGGPPQVVRSPQEYEQMIKSHLMTPSGGYTHLYEAASHAVTDLLQQEAIKNFLLPNNAEPVVVLLTDGFNNQKSDDTCGTNVDRLQAALDTIRQARRETGGSLRPRVVTVGLGGKYQKKEKPQGLNKSVTPQGLCGKYVNNRIDRGLEKYGIDHISLQWLAEAGGGQAFVKRNPKGLADVFSKAAADRYKWFELRYRVPDPFYHRKSFEVELRRQGGTRSLTNVKISPSGWLDGPPGVQEPGERWAGRGTIRQTFALVMPILGFLVFLTFVGPAWFNARRALLRRARARK